MTLSMGVIDTRIAASMFAVLQTMSSVGIGAGDGVATALSDNMEFSGVFRTLAIANLAVIPLILFVTSRFNRVWTRPGTDPVLEEAQLVLRFRQICIRG